MIHFIKLIRYPNLLILILSQYLIRFCIIKPFIAQNNGLMAFSELNFALLVVATILISGAGYIINDYFDLESDKINKPAKQIISVHISIETARLLYFVMNLVALIIGIYLAMEVGVWQLSLIFLMIITMLWYYSARYKRLLFWGNFVVSTLTAFSIFIVWLFEFFAIREDATLFVDNLKSIQIINLFIWGYVFFAFIVSFIREIIKDAEDVEGDLNLECKTIPIVVEKRIFKFIVNGLIVITIGALGYAQFYLWRHDFSYLFWYILVVLIPLFIYLIYLIFKANTKTDYSSASIQAKIIMIAGIISMFLILFN